MAQTANYTRMPALTPPKSGETKQSLLELRVLCCCMFSRRTGWKLTPQSIY